MGAREGLLLGSGVRSQLTWGKGGHGPKGSKWGPGASRWWEGGFLHIRPWLWGSPGKPQAISSAQQPRGLSTVPVRSQGPL